MIKRSSLSNQLTESRGWWERGSVRIGEWTYEGGRKQKRVETDGERTRYQGVTVWLYSKVERMIFHQFGWYRRIFKSCPIEICG